MTAKMNFACTSRAGGGFVRLLFRLGMAFVKLRTCRIAKFGHDVLRRGALRHLDFFFGRQQAVKDFPDFGGELLIAKQLLDFRVNFHEPVAELVERGLEFIGRGFAFPRVGFKFAGKAFGYPAPTSCST